MRLLVLLFLALSLAASAAAQGNTTENETASSNESVPANETPANETPAAPAGPITIEIEGYQEGSATYFTLKGQTARNPAITVAPGQQVTFVFTAISGFHNLNVNDEAKTKIIGDGESETITWTAPAEDGRLEYWCDPHRGSGMKGAVAVGGSADLPAGGGGGTITGDTIDLGQHDPACAGQVAPAIVAEGVVGAPTLQDYIDACTPQEVVAAKSGADYVIPISWALLGAGVLGVVWVHKYYKP